MNHIASLFLLTVLPVVVFGDDSWPPEPMQTGGRATQLTGEGLLAVPDAVTEQADEEGAAPFVVAGMPAIVRVAFHEDLGPDAAHRRLWSSWGDICLASDGSVYCGIGDHGDDAGGDARCFLYRWNPAEERLTQVVDMNDVVPHAPGQPAWSKVHARIDEGPDGGIYFSCTLNAGNRAGQEQYHWNDQLPGGQLYRYDPATGQTGVIANLPAKRCSATSLLDRERNIWWCNLEAGEGDALWGLDLTTAQTVFQSNDGAVGFNRNFALAADGSIVFNGVDCIRRFEPATGRVMDMDSSFPDSPGMRCSTRESTDGWIYGITHQSSQLFRYSPGRDELELLGPNWLGGMYTTVIVLSPDERFLYYFPGAHGQAFRDGTPVLQYEIATGRRKVLAFLAPELERVLHYVPGGTYGMKLSADGGTIYVNFNGHAADGLRPEGMRDNGFGLCGFAEIEIAASER